MAKNERHEMYEGIERILNKWAKVFREPIQKVDKFEHDGPNITRVYRDGKLLFRLGKKIPMEPKGSFAKIVHIEVDPNPGNMPEGEVAKEGYGHLAEFRRQFSTAFGPDALWRPAWRVECEIHLVEEPEPEEGLINQQEESETKGD